ncbi:glycosyltransferase family 61 protein [Methylophilus medardicus]|uniref:Glycosyltransferase family 61 protein n=1 Tax=Methylophilus medardicus TaxID=2588534 RepID=A0A5B8CSN1_9PROT|nr:glycosyltransferase 61 family protein [Methylophilus medardicus]QDC44298.1 glycosyltransferase family 61 protein [Methylophilus medardicus]QDC49305.1 glycosyltransferase family 61 protein [Methylophilus medardicus]QDC53010.1 glycosyltransferase family 61 protein [Methylophilus medardicus]
MNTIKFFADFYRRFLSQFLIFRLIKHLLLFLVKKNRKLRAMHSRSVLSGSYKWIALAETQGIIFRQCITAPEKIFLPSPSFTGFGAAEASMRTPTRDHTFPEIAIFSFDGATIVGGTDFVLQGNQMIHHDLYIPSEHQCPAENIGLIDRHKDNKTVDLWLTLAPSSLESGVSMISQCSGNYAHWLTETLPKLALLDSIALFDRTPLLIDDHLHPNIIQSLNLLNKKNRQVITVSKWAPVTVNQLIAISNPGYERYASNGLLSKEPEPYVNKFSAYALKLLRESIINALLELKNSGQSHSDLVYLARSHSSKNLRQIINATELEAFLDAQHVQRVESDHLTFIQQVQACMSAKLIVSPIGAALTNMIFAPTGCKIICLSPYYDDANYFYYANLAATLGHEIHFVLGQQAPTDKHPMHKDYSINVELLKPYF